MIELGTGSGSLAIVCLALGRSYLGFELDNVQVSKASIRLDTFAAKLSSVPLITEFTMPLDVADIIEKEDDKPAKLTAAEHAADDNCAQCRMCFKVLVLPYASCPHCKAQVHSACLENGQGVCDQRACRLLANLPVPEKDADESTIDYSQRADPSVADLSSSMEPYSSVVPQTPSLTNEDPENPASADYVPPAATSIEKTLFSDDKDAPAEDSTSPAEEPAKQVKQKRKAATRKPKKGSN